ncbi:hypothetical protein PYCC9005_000300 [Savitreella phatthalungensis]
MHDSSDELQPPSSDDAGQDLIAQRRRIQAAQSAYNRAQPTPSILSASLRGPVKFSPWLVSKKRGQVQSNATTDTIDVFFRSTKPDHCAAKGQPRKRQKLVTADIEATSSSPFRSVTSRSNGSSHEAWSPQSRNVSNGTTTVFSDAVKQPIHAMNAACRGLGITNTRFAGKDGTERDRQSLPDPRLRPGMTPIRRTSSTSALSYSRAPSRVYSKRRPVTSAAVSRTFLDRSAGLAKWSSLVAGTQESGKQDIINDPVASLSIRKSATQAELAVLQEAADTALNSQPQVTPSSRDSKLCADPVLPEEVLSRQAQHEHRSSTLIQTESPLDPIGEFALYHDRHIDSEAERTSSEAASRDLTTFHRGFAAFNSPERHNKSAQSNEISVFPPPPQFALLEMETDLDATLKSTMEYLDATAWSAQKAGRLLLRADQ